MNTIHRITYASLLILMFRCESRQVEIVPGTYYLVGDAVGKSYAIGCMQFLREEKPFRLKFSAKNVIEFFPAISSTGEMSDQFKGFSGKYEIRGNRLIVVPLFQVTDTLYHKVIFVSKDSLVLQDGYGNLEPYKMHPTQKALKNSYWKFEIESSANISTCSPYRMKIDTTGLIALTMRDKVFTRNLSNEMVRKLFARINSISAIDLRKEPVMESDVRSVKLVLWKSEGYEEVEAVCMSLPGFKVVSTSTGGYKIFRRGKMLNVFWDGFWFPDPSILDAYSASQVGRIEVHGSAVYMWSKLMGGRAVDIKKSTRYTLRGFQNPKSFSAPTYDVQLQVQVKPDYRATLHWAPNLVTDSLGHVVVEFYTSDLETEINIQIEGLTLEGAPFAARRRFTVRSID